MNAEGNGAMVNTEISVRGRVKTVPCIQIDDTTVFVAGGGLKIACVKDEEYNDCKAIEDPENVIRKLRSSDLKADIFKFSQPQIDPERRHAYDVIWDNAAIVSFDSFQDWWVKRVIQTTRKSVRLSRRRGVSVEVVPFDDDLVAGIKSIYDESPNRQGRPFWHYGKSLETIKEENGTYQGRSDFIGAYSGDQLIGYVKVTYTQQIAVIMQIITLRAHQDKRPTNALLAKTVEQCAAQGLRHLKYAKFTYGNKGVDALTEFKISNGFARHDFPCYYIPLTWKGRVGMGMQFHRSLRDRIPRFLEKPLLQMQARFCK
ncbi:hypothetical protein N9V84_09590 [Verrucomicrobiales bacterium]|jgi:hypothetical protein|nr:hypothetical protein [Verrucomicrobiales bacterium]